MAHVQDRWWRDKKDPVTKQVIRGPRGKPVREKTELYGQGDRYRVRYFNRNGKERSNSFPDKQLGRAKAFKAKVETEVYAGDFVDPSAGNIKVREYGDLYKMGRSQDPSSQETLTSYLEHQIYPFMGDQRIRMVGIDTLREWVMWLNVEKKVSMSYQVGLWGLLFSMFEAAVGERRIRTNPCRNSSISPPKALRRKIVPWSESRLDRVTRGLGERYRIMMKIGAGLGLRQGEIFAFSPDDIDRQKMIYHCRNQMTTQGGERYFKLPKGHKTRDVPLSSGVLADIDAYMEEYQPVEITLPWAERDGKKFETIRVLVVNENGDLHTRQAFNDKVWKIAFRDALLVKRRWDDGMHALRHLYASHLLSSNVSIREVAEYLGHSSPAFTLRVYAHLMPSSHDRARAAVDLMFKSGPGE